VEDLGVRLPLDDEPRFGVWNGSPSCSRGVFNSLCIMLLEEESGVEEGLGSCQFDTL
jgi:hypothetical protein